MTELSEILRKECETAINWFKTNKMIVNPDKFQSMVISSNVELTMKSSVKLLGIEIDNKLNFEKHMQTSNLQTAEI